MARTNKYASVNFNHIYDKSLPTTAATNKQRQPPPPSSSYSSLSSYKDQLPLNRTHGRMLVLTRPTPKPIIIIPTPPPPSSSQPIADQTSASISLRPLGSTGSGSPVLSPILRQDRDKEVLGVVKAPKPNRFVPPHLRPGFVGKEERLGSEGRRHNLQQQGNLVSPGGIGDNGRPKSGGYDRMNGSDLGLLCRPRSSGNRPNSSG